MAGVAVVVGAGRSVWDDLRTIQRLVPAPTMFAVNDMIVHAPTVQHAVSHHPEKVPHWAALRREKVITHASAPGSGVDHSWPQFRDGRSGSSALLATRIALELGYGRVIVAGVPLDASGYVWSDPHATQPARNFARYRQGWQDQISLLRGRVFAVSGYLMDLLGPPSAARVPVQQAQEAVA